MTNTIKAALQGPELKKVKISGHEFNVKPVSYRVHNGEITVFGQLSHCLALRDDDQVWYTFRKNGATLIPSDTKKMVVKKQDGGIIKTIEHLKGVVSIIASIYGVNSDKFFDTLSKQSGSLGFLDFDGDWETAANGFLRDLAANVTVPAMPQISGLKLFQDTNMHGSTVSISVGQQVPSTGSLGWNDKASSLQAVVPEGKKLSLFKNSNYDGLLMEFAAGSHICL